MPPFCPFSKPAAGFTLIELMVVVAILAVLGLVVATNVFPYLTESRQVVARTNIETLKNAVLNYKMKHYALPEKLHLLLEPDEKNADQPYLESKDLLYDPWERELHYIVFSSTEFEIKSLGADNAEGGDGEARDISSKDSKYDDE